LRVAGDGGAGGIGLFDQVIPVVGVDARAGTGGFVDSSSEGIVFEGDGSAASGERDALEAVLVVPEIRSFLRIDWAGYIIVRIGLPDPDQLFTHPYIYVSRMCPGPRPKRAFALLKAALDRVQALFSILTTRSAS
jgi:hypothetical protein